MNTLKYPFSRLRPIALYGAALALLVFALKWLQWRFLIADHALEIYIGLIAIFFTALGGWVATQMAKPKLKTVVVEKEIVVSTPGSFSLNQAELDKLELTKREYEVLQLLVKGHSNAEMADRLFVSLSTIKTHVSNLYVKLDVKRRTQAIEKAKRLKIVE